MDVNPKAPLSAGWQCGHDYYVAESEATASINLIMCVCLSVSTITHKGVDQFLSGIQVIIGEAHESYWF